MTRPAAPGASTAKGGVRAHATEFVGLDEGAARRLADVYGHEVRVVTPGTRTVTAECASTG